MKLNLPLVSCMENKNLAKSKKEQFHKEIENWPQQIQVMINNIRMESKFIDERNMPEFKTKEEARKYFNSRPFSEFLKEWLK